MYRNFCVKDIGSWASMVLQKCQNFMEMTSNMIYIVAFGGGLKCPFKIPLGTVGGGGWAITSDLPTALLYDMI